MATFSSTRGANSDNERERPSPGASCHLHASVKSRFALKVIHDDAVVTIDDMLVAALAAEMLKDLVDAINAVQNSLRGQKRKEANERETYQTLMTSSSSQACLTRKQPGSP